MFRKTKIRQILSNHYEVPSIKTNIRKFLGNEKAESFKKNLSR